MSARMAVSVLVMLLLCGVTVVLARRFRDVPPARVLVNLLFPFSQICIVAFLLFYSLKYDLPDWMFAIVAVVGALCGPADLALFKALREAEERDASRERVRLLEEQVRSQEAYLDRLFADMGEARRVREAIAVELEAVDELLGKREAEGVSQGLMRVVGIMDATRKSFCSHRVVDALVSMKVDVCKDAGIETEVDVRLSDDVPFSSVELCAVFSNLFDNAIDACQKVPEERRFITLRARLDAGHLVVRMENGCVASTGGKKRPLRQRAGLAEHGWGLDILETMARRYEGSFQAQQRDGVFSTTVILKAGATEGDGCKTRR